MFNSQILKLIQIYESLLTPVGPVRTVQLLTNINVCPNIQYLSIRLQEMQSFRCEAGVRSEFGFSQYLSKSCSRSIDCSMQLDSLNKGNKAHVIPIQYYPDCCEVG